VSRLLLLTITN